jgi:quinol monooxygenase YgiN
MELTIKVWTKPGKFQELHQTLLMLLPTMRKEKGCNNSQLYRNVEDEEVLFLSAQWDDCEVLGRYLLSEYGSAILGGIDLLGETVKVKIGHTHPWEGIEALKRMRTAHTQPSQTQQNDTL